MIAEKKIETQRCTYSEYKEWETEENYELIDGIAYAMTAPTFTHQRISRKLFKEIDRFLEGKSCEAFYSPIAIRINADTYDDNVFLPDIVVICDKSKIVDDKSYIGAPELVVEILSPSSVCLDRVKKYHMYLKAGVKEYWIVDPESKTVNVCILHDENYIVWAYDHNDLLLSKVLIGCIIELNKIFET